MEADGPQIGGDLKPRSSLVLVNILASILNPFLQVILNFLQVILIFYHSFASVYYVNHTYDTLLTAQRTRPNNRATQRQGIKVGAFGKERLIYHHDYVVHEGYGFCRYLASEFTKDANPDEILLEFAVSGRA